jgi:hypothetical protein
MSALLAILVGAAAPAVRAQSASFVTVATVPPAMTVTGLRNLSFGNVLPGVPRTVAATAATSGRFQIDGIGGANVRLTFFLPANLQNGPNNLPIGSWTGCRDFNTTVGGCIAFTPTGGPGTSIVLHPSGNLFLWVGGTVSPSGTQAAGLYSGTITLVASYF